LFWNARGGSHTDGGAFLFESGAADGGSLVCTDKFGRRIEVDPAKRPFCSGFRPAETAAPALSPQELELPAEELFVEAARRLPRWGYEELQDLLNALEERAREDAERQRSLRTLTLLIDRRVPTGGMKRSGVVWKIDE